MCINKILINIWLLKTSDDTVSAEVKEEKIEVEKTTAEVDNSAPSDVAVSAG